ncbi:MAG: hypothetical protein HY560_10435 [Gemmatimonadetes bacterium]|nr:hypothetical protein [Gemmatimonadota bacterium]
MTILPAQSPAVVRVDLLRRVAVLCIVLVAAWTSSPAQQQPPPILQAMRDELSRSVEALKRLPDPPYFLSYEITELNSVNVGASFGALTGSSQNRRRQLDIDLRVGDYTLDNTRPFRIGAMSVPLGGMADGLVEIPVDDDAAAVRAVLWYHTDRRYGRAVEQLTRVRTNVQVKVEQEDRSADFAAEPPGRHVEPLARLTLDRRAWETKLKRYTAPFARYGDIYEATAGLNATVETRWYVNTEGSEIQLSQPQYRLFVSAATKADDGMDLPRYESYFAFTPEGLPSDEVVLKAVQQMISDLHALKVAPMVDPYTGPAILSGRASAVFFHEVFGHRVEGHRQKLESEGQTFKKQVGQLVLPPAFSVYFDPTLRRMGESDLVGAYPFDNQGVQARRVTVVENGVLRNFLMSRTPIEAFPASNGHGRKQPGMAPVARQSNLIVEVKEHRTRAELKAMLVDQIRRDHKPFGLYFQDIQGGFTITGRTIPNAFNVLPVMVYRILPDGKEELVRGVDLIGTPLTAFSKIAAADDRFEVFNGMCGAESGLVPVSAVSPGLFISQVEVQKKSKSADRPPILPAPFDSTRRRVS